MICITNTEANPDRWGPNKVRQQETVTQVITSTVSTTITTTASVTINTICALLVNVTGDCRRRRGFEFIEDPVVMLLDEGLEEVEEFFNPSAPQRMEATPRMMLPKLSNSEPRNFASPDNVQSSKSESLNQNDQQSYGLLPRIYMSQIADVVAAISSAISNGLASLVPSIVTSITTTSTTFTDTVTDSITNTATFILSGCKPPGFTFDTC